MALALPAMAAGGDGVVSAEKTERVAASVDRPGSTGGWVMLQPMVAASRTILERPASLTEGVVEAMPIKVVKPIYPKAAQDSGLAGIVQVRATIAKNGRIVKAHAVTGPPVLRVAAEDALKQWRYQPTLLNGNPVEAKAVVEFRFGPNE